MTFFTLQVRRYSSGLTPEQWEAYSTPSELVRDLKRPLLRLGPHVAAAWAKARDLPVYYIDNCWIRVPIKQEDLDAFGVEILKGEFDLTDLAADVPDHSSVVALEVEEF
jgi:hypothetical protein